MKAAATAEIENVTLEYLRRLAATRTMPAPDPAPQTPLVPTPAILGPPALSQKPRVAVKGKSVCPACRRDIYMAELEQKDGSIEMVALDGEVMTGAEYPKGKRRMLFRRNHAERCATYVLDNEKKSKHDRWRKQMEG
jgi:hypothetical protein